MAKYNRKHGLTDTPLYVAWLNMKARCDNQNRPDYRRYGGRGITYDKRWASFQSFFDDMHHGFVSGLTLERLDNSKGYSRENCKWTDRMEQANNTRRNRVFTINGESKTFAQWIRVTGIKSSTARQRYYCLGWSIQRSLGMGRSL